METIKAYLETMFSALPQTTESLRIKNELLIGMEEKYNELKAAGKSENEAIGTVISEFGNIEELTDEMGLKKEKSENDSPVMELNTVSTFLHESSKNALWTALGVFVIILGIAFLLLCMYRSFSLSGFQDNDPTPSQMAFGVSGLIIFVAVAVGIFVTSRLKFIKFDFTTKAFQLPEHVVQYVNNYKEKFLPKRIIMIVTGVSLCILSTLAIIIPSFSEIESAVFAGVVVFLIIVGIGIMLLTYAGMIETSVNKLINPHYYYANYNYQHKPNHKAEKIMGALAAFYWPMIVAAYLLWSFIWHAWAISWLIWPIGGLVFGAISGAVGAYYYIAPEKEGKN